MDTDADSRRRTTTLVDPAAEAAQSSEKAMSAAAAVSSSSKEHDPLAGALHGMNVSDEAHVTTVRATSGDIPERSIDADIQYGDLGVVGSGSFGVVFRTKLTDDQGTRTVALKKVMQDRRYKNRELEIMRMVQHCCIVPLYWFFHSPGERNEVYLNLCMEYLPTSLSAFADGYSKRKIQIPAFYVKISCYQMFRALAYLHGRGICHRDIKPQNLLLNVPRGVLKLCDFGCAKVLVADQPNVSYICSRYYRAPELCLGVPRYTHAIDVWSGGCVLAELLIGKPIFRGTKTVDQMEKIMKVLGAPSRAQVAAMNPACAQDFGKAAGISLREVLRARPADERGMEVDLLSRAFDYIPEKRPTSIGMLAHPFFDQLRVKGCRLPNGNPLPNLFNFTEEELAMEKDILPRIKPPHVGGEETESDS